MDGSTLISCSEDGSICIWEVKDFTDKMNKTDNPYSNDILISWSKLKSIKKDITEAEIEVIRLKTKNIETINKLETEIDHELNENKNMKSIDYKKAVDGVKVMHEYYTLRNVCKKKKTINLIILNERRIWITYKVKLKGNSKTR